jgi:hypothetical protein
MSAVHKACENCGADYFPSLASHPSECYNCTIIPHNKAHSLDARTTPVGIYPYTTVNTVKEEKNPDSWGKITKDSPSCLCGNCGEIFKSLAGFDLHRQGMGEEKQCINPPEMRKKGMSINQAGKWITSEYDNWRNS